MIRIKFVFGILIAVLFLIVFCLSCMPKNQGRPYWQIYSYDSERIRANSWIANKQFSIVKVHQDRVNGILRAQVDLRYNPYKTEAFSNNERLPSELEFFYRFKWLDKEGFKVPTALSTWQTATAKAGEIIHMQGTAPDKTVTDFEFRVALPVASDGYVLPRAPGHPPE